MVAQNLGRYQSSLVKKKKKTWQGLESALATAKEMRGGQEDRLPKWYTCGPTWRKGKMAE